MSRGYFGVVGYRPKKGVNVGGLWRAAHIFGAAFVGVIGPRYHDEPEDTTKAARHVPLFQWADVADFTAHAPRDTVIVAVEFLPTATPLLKFQHPERCMYLFGPEDGNLPAELLERSAAVVMIPTAFSLNLAACCNVVLYDRMAKDGAAP